ncbi:acyl-CoA N-acyltransferase [Phaeosphaeriaceae sp. PMI808]|nr:acyl-CoA N-acyltransferase [Phaeosphaeriaceae sp. PMI808]
MEAQIEVSDTSEVAPVPQPIFTTARLIIRPQYPNDAASMSLHANNEAVAEYMSLAFPSPYTLTDAKNWIAMNTPTPPCHFGLFEASSPDIQIGGIGLVPGSDCSSHVAEIGFWIGEIFWGKGYTTEALEGFTKWSFESWEGKNGQRLRRLTGTVMSGNIGSMRCFEKCGYEHEGVLKAHIEKHGKVMDRHMFGLTKADWEAKTQV